MQKVKIQTKKINFRKTEKEKERLKNKSNWEKTTKNRRLCIILYVAC